MVSAGQGMAAGWTGQSAGLWAVKGPSASLHGQHLAGNMADCKQKTYRARGLLCGEGTEHQPAGGDAVEVKRAAGVASKPWL